MKTSFCREIGRGARAASLLALAMNLGASPAPLQEGSEALFEQIGKQQIADDALLISSVEILGNAGFLKELVGRIAPGETSIKTGRNDIREFGAQTDVVLIHAEAYEAELIYKTGEFAAPVPLVSNSIVFIAPADDPLGLIASRKTEGLAQVFKRADQPMLLMNNLGETTATVRKILEKGGAGSAIVESEAKEQMAAIFTAAKNGYYTFFGLHPLLQGLQKLRAKDPQKFTKLMKKIKLVSVLDADLRRPLVAYVRKDIGDRQKIADRLFAGLEKPEIVEFINEFRMEGGNQIPLDDVQVWWAGGELKKPQSKKKPGSGQRRGQGRRGQGRGQGSGQTGPQVKCPEDTVSPFVGDLANPSLKQFLTQVEKAGAKNPTDVLCLIPEAVRANPVTNPTSLARGGRHAGPDKPRFIVTLGQWLIVQFFGDDTKEGNIIEVLHYNQKNDKFGVHGMAFRGGKVKQQAGSNIKKSCNMCHTPQGDTDGLTRPIWQLGPLYQTAYGATEDKIIKGTSQDKKWQKLDLQSNRYQNISWDLSEDSQSLKLEAKPNKSLAEFMLGLNAKRVGKILYDASLEERSELALGALFGCSTVESKLASVAGRGKIESFLKTQFYHPAFAVRSSKVPVFAAGTDYLDALEMLIKKQNQNYYEVLLQKSPLVRPDVKGWDRLEQAGNKAALAVQLADESGFAQERQLAQISWLVSDKVEEPVSAWSFATIDQGGVPSYFFSTPDQNGLELIGKDLLGRYLTGKLPATLIEKREALSRLSPIDSKGAQYCEALKL